MDTERKKSNAGNKKMTSKITGNNGYKITEDHGYGDVSYRLTTCTNCRQGFEKSTVLKSKVYKKLSTAVKAGDKDLAIRS